MTHIEPKAEGPVNDLFLAINFYVSTGDHIGEGVATDWNALPGHVMIQIPYDPKNKADAEDFGKFVSRMAEIAVADPSLSFPVQELGKAPGFTVAAFPIRERDMRRLARELVRSGGVAGWGSGKAVIDRHFPEARAMLLSGEGL